VLYFSVGVLGTVLAETGTMRGERVKEIILEPGASTFLYAGQLVRLTQRAQLSRVLQALTEAHLANPGAWIDCLRLIDVAWQGERMKASAAMNRLHVAIANLRRLGLRPVLQSKRGAYRIRSDVRVVVADARRLEKRMSRKKSKPVSADMDIKVSEVIMTTETINV
jgi:hypothetical protein